MSTTLKLDDNKVTPDEERMLLLGVEYGADKDLETSGDADRSKIDDAILAGLVCL